MTYVKVEASAHCVAPKQNDLRFPKVVPDLKGGGSETNPILVTGKPQKGKTFYLKRGSAPYKY